MRVAAELNVTVWGDGDPVVLVHGSLGSGTQTWAAQRSLAETHRLLLVDRRGFGESPGPDAGDFAVDADDLVELTPEGAQLVGHSYGGVASLLAASRMPDVLRSLTVIEPPALGLARGIDAVEEFIARVQDAKGQASDANDYVRRFFAAFGLPPPPTPFDVREATSSWKERSPWEARIPLEDLRAAPFPKLVVRGMWDAAPHALGRKALHAVCDVLVDGLEAESAAIPGAAHSVPRVGGQFNERLRAFWEST